MRLLDWIIGKEPVATATGLAALVGAALGAAAAFGLGITPEQIAAVGAFVAALAGYLGRRAVTPITTPYLRRLDRDVADPPSEIGTWTEQSPDPRGSIPLALVILIALAVLMLAGLGFCGDALFEDENETNDVGMSLVQDHDGCYDYECDGDYQGGPSGGRYEGGRGGNDYDGDGDGNRCRNFCFYGVPYPGQPGYPNAL